ncbi:hypothetical protein [Algoriphagus persicinus]|uniref:hypothetical protein n=1 Tax=Algoriphagus persicinus TaxID=3108754 RepID=UPI002B382772|nr:hypothetical protein [Algoriphagus sp. E1-3-M2]MEB2786804.1 hypothetical protein [Algoriphagus sp. E1-3-M2]
MKRKFSDLHCHNHMRAHLHMQEKRKAYEKKDEFSPWTVITSNRAGYVKGKMGASYSQCDLVKAWNGNVRLTFNSLYPLERQFVLGLDRINTSDLLNIIVGVTTDDRLPLRDLIQTFYMRIPRVTVNYVQSKNYDYWESLKREFEFVLMDSGKTIESNKIHTTGVLRRIFENEKKRASKFRNELWAENARYLIPDSKNTLEESLQNDEEITMILTIEGSHALGTDLLESGKITIEEISNRIQVIKNDWKVPVFFITFSHHFNNNLCGHAHSIPDKGKILLNQVHNMNKGFTDLGKRIVLELLGLNENLEKDPNLGYRILIDVKHMSACGRQEYYDQIVRPCLEKGDIIPVIASHCGFSGVETLQEHIDCFHLEKDDFTDKSKKFNAWNINVCEEDIEMIVKTGGLFGLSFDQRILGITKKNKKSKRNGIELLWDNIEGIAKSAYNNPKLTDAEKPNIWKCMTLGTDFEGLIDPIDHYPTVLEFELFSNNLIFEIEQARKDPNTKHLAHLKSREDTEALVNDFCYTNAEAFVKANYPK